MIETINIYLLLIPFIGVLALEIHLWFWRTKESSWAPIMFLVSIPISTNEPGWPLWLRWCFPFAVFIADIYFSILMNTMGWRGIARRKHRTAERASELNTSGESTK